jgi:hypothetical protein
MTEAGGDLDTVRDDGEIYEILLRKLWAEWDHIKNGPHREETRNWDLLWVSPKAGKRESRRFLGDVILTQTDLEAGRRWEDDIAYGGHDLDDHQSLGAAGSNIFGHSIPPMYGIPFRSCYSRNTDNLLLAGRLISATHLAHSSSRVMRTGGAIGQAVGLAAALCRAHKITPRELHRDRLPELRQGLMRRDGAVLCRSLEPGEDLARQAVVTASSESRFIDQQADRFVPVVTRAGNVLWDWPRVLEGVEVPLRNEADADQEMYLTLLRARRDPPWTTGELYKRRGWNDLRDEAFAVVGEQSFRLLQGHEGWLPVAFDAPIEIGDKDPASDADRMIIALNENASVWWALSPERHETARMVEHSHHDSCWHGVDAMMAMRLNPSPSLGEAANVINGFHRRFSRGPANLWISGEPVPQDIVLEWSDPVRLSRLELTFDNLTPTRAENPWESGERVHPMLTKAYEVSVSIDAGWTTLVREENNIHRFRTQELDPVTTRRLRLRVLDTHGGGGLARVYQISAFA